MDRLKNEEIRERLQQEEVLEKVKRRLTIINVVVY